MSAVPISTPPADDRAARIAQLGRELQRLLTQREIQRRGFRRNQSSAFLAEAARVQTRITEIVQELAAYDKVQPIFFRQV